MQNSLPVSCNELLGWAVASCSAKGIRGSMEDVSVTQGVLAVLDGHNGHECANFLAPQLRALVQLPQEQWIDEFIKLDDTFRAQGQPSGSTCTVVAMRGKTLEVANLGDSRTVLFRSGKVVAHTVDHKPDSPNEQDRILRSGGAVEKGGDGPSRIGGVAVSRAFGTYVSPINRKKTLKDPALPHADRLLSCIPELFMWSAENGDILVLACDGVWDVLSEDDVGDIVSGKLAPNAAPCDVANSARAICERALQTSTDNVSCIVAEFGGALPQHSPEPCSVDAGSRQRCFKEEGFPGFNRASHEEQLEIGHILEYGETLIDIMVGLETDLIIERLWLGQVGDACFAPFLGHANVSKVVNCAAEIERPDFDGIQVHALKWRDSADQGKAEVKGGFRRLKQATLFINESIEAGETVLVHCVQGVSRSASVVVAYLMEYRQMSIEDAVQLVREKHPVALRPFPLQEMLRAFHYFLKGQS